MEISEFTCFLTADIAIKDFHKMYYCLLLNRLSTEEFVLSVAAGLKNCSRNELFSMFIIKDI